MSHNTVVAVESRIRRSAFGPRVAAVAYWIWHKAWDLYFIIRAIFKGHLATISVADLEFRYDMRDRAVARILYIFRDYESEEVVLLANKLAEGMTFIDIGANSGYFTIIASNLVGPSGKVIAFEPSPENIRLLSNNVKANVLTNVEVVDYAICESSKGLVLHLSSINPGDHRTYESADNHLTNAGRSRMKIQVKGISLDEYLVSNESRIDAIKMDIQGAEYDALQGMHDTIMNNESILLMTEYWPHGLKLAGCSPRRFLDVLTYHGFRLFTATGQGQPLETNPPELEKGLSGDQHVTIFCSRKAL